MRAADFTKMVEGIVPNTNNVMGEFLKSNNIKFDLRGERACTMGRMEFGFHGDHFFFFPNGRNTTNYSVYQVHKRHANRVGEINYNKEIENKLPPFTIPWFRQWAIEKMSDQIVYENIRQYVYNWAKTTLQKEGGLVEGLEQSLSSMVNQDQSERNEYANFVKLQAGGNWTKGAKMYAQLKKRSSNDIFGDVARLNQFMKMKFDFDKFTDEDWDNYWLLAQHCDNNREFQKNALSIIKKYQGTAHSHYKYLYDRISMGLTGKQKYGTQNVKEQAVSEDQNINLDIDYFMNEGCGIFAVAMALNEENSQIYIISNKNGQSWSKSFPYEISHVFVNVSGKGQFDIRGKRSPEKMANDFNLNKEDYSIKGPFAPKEFFSKFMGDSDTKPLYGTSKDIKQVQQQIKSNLDEKLQGVAEGLIDYAQRKLGLKWGKIGDVVNGSVVAKYLDSQDDSMDPARYINSKFKLINITANEAEKYREISDLTGWPSDTPLEKVKGWGIDDYKMDRIRKNDVTYQSLMKHTPVVSRRGFIINGNHRIARALEMGIDPIPILKELPQGVSEGLSIDVPNEEWLQDKIDYAKRKGRDEWGVPFFGSTTAYVRPNPQVSVVRLEMLKGMRNEQNNVRKKDLEWLMAYMEKTGILPPDPHGNEYAPYVMVAYNGEAWVNEGNHRIMAAYRLGWKKMPIEIKYFDGGERVESGIMYPGKIGLGQPAGKPISR